MENEMVKNEEPSIPVVIAAPVEVRTRMRVGRALDNDWVIEQPHISAHHAVLTINEGSLQIEDLGSTHGTFVLDELANWVRIAQGSPAVVKIGQRFRFANLEAVSSHDESKRTNVHFVKPDGKFSHSIGFFFAGEQQSELHRLEQVRLNAEDAAKHPQPPKVEEPKPKLRSPTEMQQSIAKSGSPGNGLSKAFGVGVVILGAIALLAVLIMWGTGGFNSRNVVATTETETSTESETSTPTETITETETSTPVVSETSSPTVPAGFTCRPGRERTDCDSVEHFLLGGGTGGRWDCSGLSYEEYRAVYRPTQPAGASPNVIADLCSCQWCEPDSES
jgi:predicted component of type VI protein secretion system